MCDQLFVDHSAMAQFFMAIGGALYKLHLVNMCIVEYGHMLLFSHLMENSHTFRIPKVCTFTSMFD
jgi:hypothetical protein